ncbi:1,4-alpha-glucan branching enzyme GlgB [Tepiditoga spiralis]|uniref:1,4-alpha-glucan branching enzyme GlgB n=1 Tax=Tepiditoga spiralis TaxID=2108365 RepID=A0A7G1G9N2_9BACT|nr:1,4-alpha-glucan branching protein GlgB [Tepiditoga spiralis]BBE30029.1 1,4-alpha-glucan branching enzyme GlgB [Tepiditoga spiralis]
MSLLTDDEIKKIINADCHDPFKYLGMHKLNKNEMVVRVFKPDAEKVRLVSKDKRFYLEKINENGLFEKVFQAKEFFKYKFEFTGINKNKWTLRDPYSFLPQITEYDLYLFNEGNHHKIYEKLGAHKLTINRISGVLFSVWAPSAKRVSVIGNFNNWDGRVHQMRVLGSSGVWEIFIPGIKEGDLYKFEIKAQNNEILLKTDPYAFYNEVRPSNASIVYTTKYKWNDKKWIKLRKENNWEAKPISTYEVHLGSWVRNEENKFLSYLELSEKLVNYVKEQGFTHVEFMSIEEHPLDESWGYQVTGYYAPTSRFGRPEHLKYLIDKFHENNIGVILDWVPGHFPKDAHALGRFDGTGLYEHIDPRLGEHIDWGTYIFNYGRNEVKNFLISNALYWVEKFHFDGLRVDAVASMLYLDYSRKDGEWIPNKYGGRENLEAIEFMKYLNSIMKKYHPGVLMIAEESTSFDGVTRDVENNGLGYTFKWNMGWMHDTLEYFKKDPIYRKYAQNEITFSMVYAFSEKFILSLSHDEVVYGKKSLLEKMPGDDWQKFANLRLLYAYMYSHPGKKLIFMGSEFAQRNEWDCKKQLDWNLLQYESHRKMQNFVKDLNKIYKENKELYELDSFNEGFEWIDFNDSENSVLSFIRKSRDENEFTVCIFNFTPVPRYNYRIGVPKKGTYVEIMNTDWEGYWGSNVDNIHEIKTENVKFHGRDQSINITLPPLAALYIKFKK